MTRLEEKIARIRMDHAVKNIRKQQVTFADMCSIVRWQNRDRGMLSMPDSVMMMNIQSKYN